jgi:hypothetical protein
MAKFCLGMLGTRVGTRRSKMKPGHGYVFQEPRSRVTNVNVKWRSAGKFGKNRYWCTVEIICFFSYVSKNPSALAEPSGWRWQEQKHRDPSPSHFNCFMWSSVASARGNGVSPAPDLLRSRALRLSPRCAFGPPLPPAGDQQPEEFLDAAAYVRLGTSNTCSSFLLDSDYSDCFRFSLSL